jgi:hypothetical protein
METWYEGQVRRMAAPNPRPIQNTLLLDFPVDKPKSQINILEERAHAIINQLIEDGDLDADQIVSHHWIECIIGDLLSEGEDADDDLPLAA